MALEKHPMWRAPQHHMDVDQASNHVHWIELFYDLIHVVIIFLLGNFLGNHLTPTGFVYFVGLFIAVWYSWADTSLFNSLYVSTDIKHRFLMATQIVVAMIMAAAIPSIDGSGWLFFALAFSTNRILTAYFYIRTKQKGAEESILAHKMGISFFVFGVMFAISAFLPAPYSYLLFASGIVGIQLLYMLPKVGILECERFVPRLGHMSERFALLVLIVVGEGFFKLVITLAQIGIANVSFDVFINYVFGGFSVFALCWIYFDFVGNGKPKNIEKSTLVQWWLAHLVLMLAGVMIGVALTGEVKVRIWEPYPLKYAVIGCTGLAAYLASLLWIQNLIEKRVAHRFGTARIRIVGITLALFTLVTIPYVPSWVGNLLWGSALFSQILFPVSKAYFTLLKEEQIEQETKKQQQD
ncbi:low temperature requirement protein A [Thalassotalea sp. Y01]|uniref:low temperature requirement protein A n=1 Tax=Thalassotalea sp. Y01 TaxID=2729613 RepID=UPI00145FA637|nr:low temperature requirement protein A [Thalassotalea sp. Y01]NMP14994.1 low temperature requirement protein A [Thalassotalea sp. Y01]